jgi:putative heme uptake system protein
MDASADDDAQDATAVTDSVTYLLVDGENLDATLGVSILGRRPVPADRPRWERVLEFAAHAWERPVKGLFFINATAGTLPMPFVQALTAIGFRPVPLAGPPGMKVVDVGIQRTLEAIADRDGDVMLGSHDADFHPQVEALLHKGRRVALLAFREYVSTAYAELADVGLQVFDLEDDVQAFNQLLPRVRIIDIDRFDPTAFL